MNRIHWAFIAAICVSVVGCGSGSGEEPARSDDAPFIVMDESLAALKEDFNAASGTVRLLFLSGPTCGICLRGLADMNTELLGGNTDHRLRTFVAHVPTLNAGKEDARNSMTLIDNPYTRHYWEDTGVVGRLYQEMMDMDIYLWDMWFIYGPGARWEKRLPPEPDFWMHQLGPLPDESYLDAEAFARRANELLSTLPGADSPQAPSAAHDAAPAAVESVAQPVGVALQQHISGRGGYRNLAAIESLRMEGTITTAEGTRRLAITANKNGTLTRTVGDGESESTASRRGARAKLPSAGSDRGLPGQLERQVMESFEMTGPLVDWKAKGHRLEKRMGMVRVGGNLAWELDLVQKTGHRWRIYVDSHTGMERRRLLLEGDGEPVLEIRFDDYRIAEPDTPYPSRFGARKHHTMRGFYGSPGYVFPYRIEYRHPNGDLIATESLRFIDVEFDGERA